MAVEIITPGALTTVQDAGRTGYARSGYRPCGVCDTYAFALGNLLAGNLQNPGAAVLEMTLAGAAVRFTADTVFALTGADMAATLDGTAVPQFCPVLARGGSTLRLGTATAGLRTYLAVYGGLDVPLLLGSRSTDTACGIGGVAGSALVAGDRIAVGQTEHSATAFWLGLRQRLPALRSKLAAADGFLCRAARPWRFVGGAKLPLFRCVAGPQQAAFTAAALQDFVQGIYTVTPDANRMACKLAGPPLAMVHGADILSDGIVCGSVQVAADGQPMVMLADHQTTGGYAKIATVIRTDIAAMAQVRPGEKVTFAFVSPAQAVAAARAEARRLAYMKEMLEGACLNP